MACLPPTHLKLQLRSKVLLIHLHLKALSTNSKHSLGIDAPEGAMPFGKEAKEELVKLVQGTPLKVYIYGDDIYGRSVGVIYCNGIFVQMLRKGCAWHYDAYDKRPELAVWEQEARHARVGLWASSNPEKPWNGERYGEIELKEEVIEVEASGSRGQQVET